MSKVTTEHLARSAYVYIRQSTADQLTHNHGAGCGRSRACRSQWAWRRTKHVAKIAWQVAKPDGLVVVDPEAELEFLHTTCRSS